MVLVCAVVIINIYCTYICLDIPYDHTIFILLLFTCNPYTHLFKQIRKDETD